MAQPITPHPVHLEQALEQIRAEGGLRDHPQATLAELMFMDIPSRLIKLRALLIGLGRCTAQVPTTHHRPQVIAPEAPFPPPSRTHRPARPYQPPKHQAVLFDARAAAAGDMEDRDE